MAGSLEVAYLLMPPEQMAELHLRWVVLAAGTLEVISLEGHRVRCASMRRVSAAPS